jgi:hypothetical protein
MCIVFVLLYRFCTISAVTRIDFIGVSRGTRLVLVVAMIRETLEMIPVAILLAVILAFGAQSQRARSISMERDIPRGPVMPLFTVAGEEESCAIELHTGAHGWKETGSPSEEPSPALGRSAGPGLFLDWNASAPGVPVFTSADVMRSRSGPPDGAAPALSASTPTTTGNSIAATGGSEATVRDSSGLVRLNCVDAKTLLAIPGIGPARARTVVDRRPPGGYRSWTEIDALPGFGEGTVMMMKLHAVLD